VLHRIANHLYHRADRIVSVTPGIKVELLKKGIPWDRVDVFTNGFDPEVYELPARTREHVRTMLGWEQQFVAVYLGTHVEVTALDVIVRAAAELRARPDIRFDLFGAGQRKQAVMDLAKRLKLTNIHFHDPVPKKRVPELLAGADVALMTLFFSPLIHIYFENKFMDYMGAAKPILAAMEGQQAEIIQKYRTGQVVPTFDHVGLAELVAEAAREFEPFREMGLNGRRLVEQAFLLPRILDRYVAVIEAVGARQTADLTPWEPLS
jgi:glycosyltransferase involved in cell wall biosynthesis